MRSDVEQGHLIYSQILIPAKICNSQGRLGEIIGLPNRYRSLRPFKSLFWVSLCSQFPILHSQQDLASLQTLITQNCLHWRIQSFDWNFQEMFSFWVARKLSIQCKDFRAFLPTSPFVSSHWGLVVELGGSVGGGDRPDESFSIILTTSLGFLHHYPSPLVLMRMECRKALNMQKLISKNQQRHLPYKVVSLTHIAIIRGVRNGPDSKLVSRLSEYFNILPAINIWV